MTPKLLTLDRVIARIAAGQQGVVTSAGLLAAGLEPEDIKLRVRRGTLIPVHRGVYRVGHSAPSLEAGYMEAVLACGEGGLLRGLAAAYLYVLIKGSPPEPEVTAPKDRTVDGVLTHWARAGIHRQDVARHRGIPVTSVARTLVDIAGRLGDEELARACHEATVRFKTKAAQVEAVLRRRPRTRGANRLRALLSKLESAFMALLRKHELPLPKTNKRRDGHLIDCRWPEPPVTVELDSYAFHNTRHSWEQDRNRDRAACRRGDRILSPAPAAPS